jgi:PadR family transcriptional regulator, regulatory protein AphA
MSKNNIAKYIILGILSHEPSSGYEIKKKVEFSISYFWSISYGQIYPILKRLEEERLATKEVKIAETGPNRKIYTITEKGKIELREWLLQPEKKENEILLKLFYGSQLSKEDNIEKIENFSKTRSKEIIQLEHSQKELISVLDKDEDHVYFLLVALFGISTYKAHIKWSEMAIKLLNEMKNGNDNLKIKEILEDFEGV